MDRHPARENTTPLKSARRTLLTSERDRFARPSAFMYSIHQGPVPPRSPRNAWHLTSGRSAPTRGGHGESSNQLILGRLIPKAWEQVGNGAENRVSAHLAASQLRAIPPPPWGGRAIAEIDQVYPSDRGEESAGLFFLLKDGFLPARTTSRGPRTVAAGVGRRAAPGRDRIQSAAHAKCGAGIAVRRLARSGEARRMPPFA